MKLFVCTVVLLVGFSEARSQMPWTSPIQLTTGGDDDLHPSFVANGSFYFQANEWLAFSRGDSGSSSRNICLLRSSPFAHTWPDTLFQITEDSARNDFPVAARMADGNSETIMVLWEKSGQGFSQIWARLYTDSSWEQPVFLGDGVMPTVSPTDSGFGAVWVKGTTLLFSSFELDTWSSPETVAIGGNLAIRFPQIRYLDPWERWVVVWQQEKIFFNESELFSSVRRDTGWTVPEVLAANGDNRNPSFHKIGPIFSTNLTWESNWTGDWEIYTIEGQVYGNDLVWLFGPKNVSTNSITHDNDPSFQVTPIITQEGIVQSFFTAAAWVISTEISDSIALKAQDAWNTQYRTVAPGTTDRNPDISAGVPGSLGLRVWVVWENNTTGHWKLYGVSKDISLDVEESQTTPAQFSLDQNYPNPFNPSTTISFITPHSSFITLKVYNLLGQKVATLVDGIQDPGFKSVQWDASGFAGGVYIYRIQAGEYSQSRKMLLIK